MFPLTLNGNANKSWEFLEDKLKMAQTFAKRARKKKKEKERVRTRKKRKAPVQVQTGKERLWSLGERVWHFKSLEGGGGALEHAGHNVWLRLSSLFVSQTDHNVRHSTSWEGSNALRELFLNRNRVLELSSTVETGMLKPSDMNLTAAFVPSIHCAVHVSLINCSFVAAHIRRQRLTRLDTT